VNGVGASRTRLLNILMQLRKCTNHPYLFDGAEPGPPYTNGPHIIENSGKMCMLDKLLERLEQVGSRVLIFSQMTRMLDILEDYCWMKEYNYCRIDGSTDGDTRDTHIANFNRPGSDKFLFLLSTRAGGLGINLATADIVILYDSDWNPQMDLQAMDRAHRIGQKKPVKVFRFITEGSVEQRIIDRATRKLKLDALVIQQGRTADNKNASKDDLISMIKYGADEVLRGKGGTITDDDIDEILARGEAMTKEKEEKLTKSAEESLYKFNMDGGMGSVYDWEDKDYRDGNLVGNFIDLGKRGGEERGRVREVTMTAKLPRMPKMPVIQDFQFYDSKRLNELLDKQKRAIMARHEIEVQVQVSNPGDEEQAALPEIVDLTEEEEAEKEKLLSEGFQDWNKRDFTNYVRACEKYGRSGVKDVCKEVEGKTEEQVKEYHKVFWRRYHELEDSDKHINKIEQGEAKINRHELIQRILREKVGKYRDPFNQLTIKYGNTVKGKGVRGAHAFNEEEDRYLLCMSQKLGYGNWEKVKAELRNATQFRFDWFIKSRTPKEIGQRVENLIKLIEKEKEEDAHFQDVRRRKAAKRKPDEAAGGSAKKGRK